MHCDMLPPSITPSHTHTHTHVNGHEQASAPPFLVRLGWEVYIKTDSKCIYNTAPGMMIKDPWGSMATKHTLRMLGVSEAEMPHIRHISLRRRLSDWRFLLLSRILQSGTSREQSKTGDEWTSDTLVRKTLERFEFSVFSTTVLFYLLTLRVLSFPVCQSPPSRGLMSSAPVPSTNPTASAGRAAERSPFSSVPCGTCSDRHHVSTAFQSTRNKH